MIVPVYTSECKECGLRYTQSRSISNYRDTPKCEACFGPTYNVILGAPQVVVKGKFDPFRSMVDGSVISCQRDLEEHNKRNSVINLNELYTEEQIQSGQLGQKSQSLSQSVDIAKDMQEAIHDVSHGYKPIVEVQEDE